MNGWQMGFHMSFREPDSSYTADIKEKLVEGFKEEEAFGYMKGNRDWEELIAQSS